MTLYCEEKMCEVYLQTLLVFSYPSLSERKSFMQNYIGTDISKAYFDAFIEGKVQQFSNDKSGHSAFIGRLPKDAWVVMECTGTYGHRLAEALVASGFLVSMVNALHVKRFGQSRAKRAKTDATDAKLLTEYAQSLEQCSDERDRLRLWTPDKPSQLFLKQLKTIQEVFLKVRTMLINETEAFNGYADVAPLASRILASTLTILESKIAALDEAMSAIVEQHYQSESKNLESIPGIARKTSVALIAAIGSIERFTSAKAFAAYCGLSPRIIESGSSVRGRSALANNGNTAIRTQLYMCALVAARYNKPCRELYQRLVAKGKSKKSAILAVAHKLIRQIYAVLKYNTLFQANNSNIQKSLAS